MEGLEAMHVMPEQLYDGPRCNSITHQPFWVISGAIFDACSVATEHSSLCLLGTRETVKSHGWDREPQIGDDAKEGLS